MKKVGKSRLVIFTLLLGAMVVFVGCDLLPFGGVLDDDGEGDGGAYEYERTPQNLLFVNESDYSSSSDNPMVDMEFAPPSELGATEYTLQQSTDGGTTWENFQDGYGDVTTSEDIPDNFSVNLGVDSHVRLLITGGTYDGQTSNEAWVPLSTIDTYFSGWSITDNGDYDSMWTENPGHTITASFTVKKNAPDNTVVEDALTYQWYRLDPDDFENMTAIAGATSNEYTTTTADKGYFIMIRATGDGVDAGGYCQLLGAYIE